MFFSVWRLWAKHGKESNTCVVWGPHGPATLQNTQLIQSRESCHLQIPSLAFWPYLNFNYCLYPHCWVDPSIWLVDVSSWALAHTYQIHRVLSPITNNIHQSVNDLHVCWWNGETRSCHATYAQVLIITIGRFPMRKCRYPPPFYLIHAPYPWLLKIIQFPQMCWFVSKIVLPHPHLFLFQILIFSGHFYLPSNSRLPVT